MIKRNNLIRLIGILTFILCINITVADATDIERPHSVDSVLVKAGDKNINVDISQYRMAKKYKTDLFEYLTKEDNYIDVVGIVSGSKVIGIGEYRMKLKFNNPAKSISLAIQKSMEVDSSIKGNIIELKEVNYDVLGMELGDISSKINEKNVLVSIPKSLFKEPINDLSIEFSKPVQIISVNGESLGIRIIDKMIRSGYEMDKYYEKFEFILGSQYKYANIIDYTDKMVLGVINENGYKKNINILLITE